MTNRKDIAGTAYDPQLAKELVEKNVYGKQRIKLLSADRENFMLMADIVQSQLPEVGFNVTIETMEWAAFLHTARAGDYDMTFLSWQNESTTGSELLYPNFHSENAGSSNRALYNNPEFDKLVEASSMTVDQEERLNYLDQANAFMLEDNAIVIMNHGVVTSALSKEYEGLELSATGQWNLKNVKRK